MRWVLYFLTKIYFLYLKMAIVGTSWPVSQPCMRFSFLAMEFGFQLIERSSLNGGLVWIEGKSFMESVFFFKLILMDYMKIYGNWHNFRILKN